MNTRFGSLMDIDKFVRGLNVASLTIGFGSLMDIDKFVQIYQYPSENRNRNILCFIAVSTFKNHIHYNSMISRLSR